MEDLTVVAVAKWMEQNGIDFISQDGNFATYGTYNEDGELDGTEVMM